MPLLLGNHEWRLFKRTWLNEPPRKMDTRRTQRTWQIDRQTQFRVQSRSNNKSAVMRQPQTLVASIYDVCKIVTPSHLSCTEFTQPRSFCLLFRDPPIHCGRHIWKPPLPFSLPRNSAKVVLLKPQTKRKIPLNPRWPRYENATIGWLEACYCTDLIRQIPAEEYNFN